MIQVISKFLILTLTLTTFGVNPIFAKDIKDKKILQLESLLQTYIEEIKDLKSQIQRLESFDEIVTENTVKPLKRSTCEVNFNQCAPKELCDLATYKFNGQIKWKKGLRNAWATEAKKRNLSCGVTVAQSQTNELIGKSSVTTGSCEANFNQCAPKELCDLATYKLDGQIKWKKGLRNAWATEAKKRNLSCGVTISRSLCEENLMACDATLLCEMSTHMSRYYENGKLVDNRAWFKTPEHRKFIDEAKRRNLSCGVADLEAKAERDRQEAEKEAKLKAEAEAKRKEIDEEMRADEVEARLANEAEKKRNAAERGRETDMALLFDRLMDGGHARVLRPAINKNQLNFCSDYYKWDSKNKSVLMEHYNNIAISTTVVGIMGVVYKEETYSQSIQFDDYWEVTGANGLVTKIRVVNPSEVEMFGQYCGYGASKDCKPAISAGASNTFAVCIFDRYPNKDDSVFDD
jgi:hypothetical protein